MIFTSLFGSGASPATAGQHSFFSMVQGYQTNAGTHINEMNAVTVPAVYACVGLISDVIAEMPIYVYRLREDGSKERQHGHRVEDLLNRRPNPRMTAFTFRKTKMMHTLLWGNGYSEVQRSQGGEPRALWLALPDRTTPQLLQDGRLLYQTESTRPGRMDSGGTLEPPDMLHVPAMGFDGVIGYSPVAVERQTMGLAKAMEEFGSRFFSNDAKSGGFLKYPGKLSPEAIKRIRESWDQQSGLDQAHRPKVLEEGMEWTSTTIPPEDAQFLASRDFQVAEIARIYRVPLHMIQSVSGSTSWGSGIAEMSMGFVRFTLNPWLVPIEQEYNNKLFTQAEQDLGFFVKHDTSDLLRGDVDKRASYYTKALNKQTGWLTRQEVRADEDRNPLTEEQLQQFEQGGQSRPVEES